MRSISRRFDILILVAAWIALLVSLGAPASGSSLGVLNMLELIVLLGASVFQTGHVGAICAILPSLAFFLATPVVVCRMPWKTSSRALVRAVGFCFLGGPWLALIAITFSPDSSGTQDLMWGYYLFSSAHSIAFLACALAPPRPSPAQAERGFPVVAPSEAAQPPPRA